MRTFLAAVLALIPAGASLRADVSFESRVQIAGGQPVVTTRAIKGPRMAILTHRHTSVIDLDAETITEIDFARKTYSVIPFARWKKILDEAASHSPRETGFKVTIREAGGSPSLAKPIGILNAAESLLDIAGTSGALDIRVDSWVETIPGYEQRRDFIDKLAARLGYAFAVGLAEPALRVPDALPGLDEAVKQVNQSRGAPVETSITITGAGKTLAEAGIQLGKFGGGAQLASLFITPEGFKKVDPSLPAVPLP